MSQESTPTRNVPWAVSVLVVLAVVAVVLGYVGLRQLLRDDPRYDDLDLLYHDLQLFVLDSAPLQEARTLPPALNVARFLAPTVTAYAVILATYDVFARRVRRFRRVRLRGHTILCGPIRTTDLLAAEIRSEGRRAVVVESAPDDPAAARAAPGNGDRVTGDPRRAATLTEAGIRGSRELVAVGPDGSVNTEIAIAAGAARNTPITCYVEIPSVSLYREAKTHDVGMPGAPNTRLQVFNRYVRAARDLLAEHPFPLPGETPPRVLVIGGGELTTALLDRMADVWQSAAPAHPGPSTPSGAATSTESESESAEATSAGPGSVASARTLVVSVLDPDLPAQVFPQRYAHLRDRDAPVLVHGRRLDLRVLTETAELSVGDSGGVGQPPTRIYLCLDDTNTAMSVAARARDLLAPARPTIVVATGTTPSLLAPAGVTVYDVARRAYTMSSLRSGTNEVLARTIHERYVEDCRREGDTPEQNPAMVPWADLPEDLRESNREQAWDIARKLDIAGYSVVPAADRGHQTTFDAAEIERLAEIEHDRWIAERVAAGWTYGPAKDLAARVTPYLMPWGQLAESVRAKDRKAVERIPELLGRVGLQMVRRQP